MSDVSPLEQMAVVLAHDLKDRELGAAGAAALVPMARPHRGQATASRSTISQTAQV